MMQTSRAIGLVIFVLFLTAPPALAQEGTPRVGADPEAQAHVVSPARQTYRGLLPSEWLQVILIVAIVATTLLTISFQLAASRAETFRNLRAGFEVFRNDLPPEASLAAMLSGLKEADHNADPWKTANSQWTALKRYWRQAFTEWYVTTQASPFFYRKLWKNYYKGALAEQCKEPTRLAALFAAAEVSSGARSDKTFLEVVLRDLVVRELKDTAVVRSAIQIATDLKVQPSQTLQEVLKDKNHGMDFVADVDRWSNATKPRS